MCVLTYFPIDTGEYILTNNRDESPHRESSLKPKDYTINGTNLRFPKDPQGGGTWIASSQKYDLVLLNGGHEIHKHQPPYRQSRGKVILDFMKYYNGEDFYKNFMFEGMEPFTLIGISNEEFFELRWDVCLGKSFKRMSKSHAHIWSSVTLYTPEVIKQREMWYQEFINKHTHIDAQKLREFHQTGGNGDEANSLNMKRGNEVRTLGISQIIRKNDEARLTYQSLI